MKTSPGCRVGRDGFRTRRVARGGAFFGTPRSARGNLATGTSCTGMGKPPNQICDGTAPGVIPWLPTGRAAPNYWRLERPRRAPAGPISVVITSRFLETQERTSVLGQPFMGEPTAVATVSAAATAHSASAESR